MANAAEVASHRVRPAAVGGDPVAVGHAHARGGAVPAEHHVARGVDRAEVGQRAIGGLERAQVGELQLLLDVDQPAVAEALEGEHVDAARAQQLHIATRRRRCPSRPGCRSGSRRGVPSRARERSSTSARRALAAAARCERPTSARSSAASDQPGRLAVGPEPKQGFAGRRVGRMGSRLLTATEIATLQCSIGFRRRTLMARKSCGQHWSEWGRQLPRCRAYRHRSTDASPARQQLPRRSNRARRCGGHLPRSPRPRRVGPMQMTLGCSSRAAHRSGAAVAARGRAL